MPKDSKSARGGSHSRGGNRSNSSRSEAAKKGWETRRRNSKSKK